jgi:hypothetical protein
VNRGDGAGKGILGWVNWYLPPSPSMPEISIPTVYGAVAENGYDFEKIFHNHSRQQKALRVYS